MHSFIITCLYLLLDHQGSEGITTHSVTGCSSRVSLNCPIFEMIHVERTSYYNGTECNQALIDQQVCGQPLTGSDTGLLPLCNGRKSCGENLYYTCSGSKAARVDYRCIQGNNVKDMCGETNIEKTNRIFLSTPNYPSSPTFTNISPCRCSINGSNITYIEILELILHTSNDGTKSGIEINYGDVTYRTESLIYTRRRVFNKRLTSSAATAEIILNHNNINKQYLWIEIHGFSMRISCKRLKASTSTTTGIPAVTQTTTGIRLVTQTTTATTLKLSSTSTLKRSLLPSLDTARIPTSYVQQTSRNLHTSASPNKENRLTNDRLIGDTTVKDQTIIALAVLSSLLLLVGCITVVVFLMLFRKGKLVWVKKSPEVEREMNPYSGLDQNRRESGSDRPYQMLNIRNSTPQYSNVSQPFYPEYQNIN